MGSLIEAIYKQGRVITIGVMHNICDVYNFKPINNIPSYNNRKYGNAFIINTGLQSNKVDRYLYRATNAMSILLVTICFGII